MPADSTPCRACGRPLRKVQTSLLRSVLLVEPDPRGDWKVLGDVAYPAASWDRPEDRYAVHDVGACAVVPVVREIGGES